MVSYPGEILRRFGRYEAVESIGRAGRTDLWRAWDPYLQRFVVVATLPDDDPAEVLTRTRNLDETLENWTDGKYRDASQVLDFEPGRAGTEPFIVLTLAADDQLRRGPAADSIGSRFGALSRHWDLLAAAGGMLLAGVLAWILWGAFPPPTEPPVVRPPVVTARPDDAFASLATPHSRRVPPTADEQRHAPALPIPTAQEPSATPTATATASPLVSPDPTPLGAKLLVERWLGRYCKGIEDRYQERGREQWRCSWQDVEISGALPALVVGFTRIDRAGGGERGEGLEILVREQIRLTCADDACRRLTAAPGTGAEIAAHQVVAPTPTVALSAGASRSPSTRQRNRPPVVEILTAPERVAPGERVVLKARVTDPDSSLGDRIECEWSVNGEALARLCWEFVWPVPATTNYGNVIFTLEARDGRGASDRKTVSIFVGPGERAIGQPTGAPTPVPASPTTRPTRAKPSGGDGFPPLPDLD